MSTYYVRKKIRVICCNKSAFYLESRERCRQYRPRVLRRKALCLMTGLSPFLLCFPHAFHSAFRPNAVLPVPSFAFQQARTLLLCRLPFASEDAAHCLRAHAELVCEHGRGERSGVVRVQRAQTIHCCPREFVRRRPPFGEFCLQRGTVLCPA
jgi:hypothetical protein